MKRHPLHHVVRVIAVVASLAPWWASAQTLDPTQQRGGPARLRNSANRPQAQAQIDEAIRKFQSDDLEERLQAIDELGKAQGNQKAVDYLIQGASDSNMSVRIKSIDMLGTVRATDATGLLVQQIFLRDVDTQTKQHILVALGKIGDPKAAKPLLDFASRNGDVALRGNALYALGDIGQPDIVPPLEKLATSVEDPTLQRLARESADRIKRRPPPAVVPPALVVDRRPGAAPAGGAGAAGQPDPRAR